MTDRHEPGVVPSHVRLLEKIELDPVTQEPVFRGAVTNALDVVQVDAADGGRRSRGEKQAISAASLREPKPSWLKVRLPGYGEHSKVQAIVREAGLNTICEEARCPNLAECWGKGTATFEILGDVCTRACRYCAVKTGRPTEPADPLEPGKLANAVVKMGVRHAVITSVDRDDLADRGAGQFAQTILAVRRRSPQTTVEVLTPDFVGVEELALQIVIGARPDVFNHNTETVPRLYRRVRPKGDYRRAMWLLRRAKEIGTETFTEGQRPLMTKSGLIVGMGETIDELKAVLEDLRGNGVDVITIGQYLRPTKRHLPVDRYYHPDEFDELRVYGEGLGFGSVFSGPLVRSSYKAEEQRFAALNPIAGVTLTSGPPPLEQDELVDVGAVPAWKADQR